MLLFTPNFGGTPAGVKQWSDRLHALAQSQCLAHPILTMLDEEGGDVANVKASWAPPWPRTMAASGVAGVRELERINGAGLRAAGVDVNLAPVADVRTNPLDDVIGDRSFGASPSVVAPLVTAAVQGLHEGGVGATVKHWPGLGGAAGNPHVAIPTDPETEAQWTTVQLPGFRAGIARPFRPWDVARDEPLDLVEVPLAAMDATLAEERYLGLNPKQAWPRLEWLLDREPVGFVAAGRETQDGRRRRGVNGHFACALIPRHVPLSASSRGAPRETLAQAQTDSKTIVITRFFIVCSTGRRPCPVRSERFRKEPRNSLASRQE